MCACTVILESALWKLGRSDESRIIVDEGNGVSVKDSNKDHPFRELDILPMRYDFTCDKVMPFYAAFSFAEVIRLIQGET